MRVLLLTVIIMYAANATAFVCYDEHIMDLAGARYNIKQQRREIKLSTNLVDGVDPQILEFAFYHECAHHQLNHIKVSQVPQIRNMWGDKEIQQEKDADNFALRTYHRNNGSDALQALYDALEQARLLDMQRLRRINNEIQTLRAVGY